MLFVHREEDTIEFRIKTVANVGVLLPVKVVKRIVFTSMPNRSESHLLRCINPESGSRSCHFVFILGSHFLSAFYSTFFSPLVSSFFSVVSKLFHAVCATNYATIFIADHYEQFFSHYLFDHEHTHKLI